MKIVALIVAPLCASGVLAAPSSPCRITKETIRVPELREGSGVAASRSRPGTLWAHNDSAEPVLVELNAEGSAVGRVRVTDAQVKDWEDVAVGPCPRESCIYVGDIGDNGNDRDHVTIYRVPEPAHGQTQTEPAESMVAKYPDGPHDAEALFVTPGPRVFIITKGDPGPVALYRFPRPPHAGTTVLLERVSERSAAKKVASKDRPTSADASPDGRWIAVRTTGYVAFYATSDLIAGRWNEAFRFDLTSLHEPRGEGVTFDANGTMFLIGEAGWSNRGGTFARLACTFPR